MQHIVICKKLISHTASALWIPVQNRGRKHSPLMQMLTVCSVTKVLCYIFKQIQVQTSAWRPAILMFFGGIPVLPAKNLRLGHNHCCGLCNSLFNNGPVI
jgi:hypothetical protein